MSSQATYTHLRDGSWGVRLVGTAHQNQTVTVTKKDGSTKDERVSKVLWTGRDSKSGQTISLCAIAQNERRENGKRCADCGGPGARVECRDSSGIVGLCCPQCAKQSRWERSFA